MNVVAYLDPASGSLIAATAAAGLAGASVAAKAMWSRQTSRFRKAGAADAVQDSAGTFTDLDEAVASPAEHIADGD